ncbi:hypothetical protein C8J57DRAFT_1535245 [Mycena rebaudengoi]|nr:hypothetical protein C8J57DRAFT_1535245 [Mycena rebaudengoi]
MVRMLLVVPSGDPIEEIRINEGRTVGSEHATESERSEPWEKAEEGYELGSMKLDVVHDELVENTVRSLEE